eukprot:scaffold109922_cov61-Attheya_sp.AAC.1
MAPQNRKDPEQSTCDSIGCGTEFVKANFMYFGRRENKMWPIITRNTTQLPTTELCAQPYSTRPPKTYSTLKTNAFTTSEGVLKPVRDSTPV